jgi:hypothetical protein
MLQASHRNAVLDILFPDCDLFRGEHQHGGGHTSWRRKDWSSLLKKNRVLETASMRLRDANGWAMTLPGSHIALEDLVPLIPTPATLPRRTTPSTAISVS